MEIEYSTDKRSHANRLWKKFTKIERVVRYVCGGDPSKESLVNVGIEIEGQRMHYFENVPPRIYLKFKKEVEDLWEKED